MPESGRKNMTVLDGVYNKARTRFEAEETEKSFVKWFSDYMLMNLEKDDFLSKYAPFLHKIAIQGNVLYLKDSKKNQVIEIRMKDGKLQCNEDDPIYLQYAMALPELSKLEN